MRLALPLAALVALSLPALAQAPQRPPGQRPPAARQPAQPPQPPAPPPGFFPCRSADEVCYIGVVSGLSQLAVLFTNDPQAAGLEAKPLELSSAEAPGTPVDLAGSLGRVVMVTGAYAAASGITKAQVVDTASPLLSFLMKQMGAGEEGPQPRPPRGRAPARR